jgi:hypothetical protein
MLKHRQQRGSVFIYVIGTIAIASLVVAGYLATVDNGRERAARETDSSTQEIDLEEGILAIKQAIEQQALTTAQIDLATSISSASAAAGSPVTFDLQATDGATGVIALANFADGSFFHRAVSLTMPGDPFLSARADIRPLSLKVTTSQADLQSARALNKRVAENPEIDLRQIPLSEFTVYAADGGIRLDSQTFASGIIGRVYARGDLQITGSLKSSYPVVSSGQVKLAGNAELDLQPPGTTVPAVKLSGSFDSSNADFLAMARTELNSQVITRQIFPMNASVTPALYQGAGTSTGAGGSADNSQINLAGFEENCAVHVAVSRQASTNPSDGSRLASWVINVTGLNNSGSEVQPGVVPSTQGRPFAVASHNGVTVLAFDYAAIGNQPAPHAISIRIYNGAVLDTNALVLVRGADRLGGDLSIVSPHPIMISGDFNIQPVGGSIPAVSLVTLQTVQIEDAADALWARQTFGAAR